MVSETEHPRIRFRHTEAPEKRSHPLWWASFYAAPSEDADPFVKVGDPVKKGQVVGIVEAMKLMNEIDQRLSTER